MLYSNQRLQRWCFDVELIYLASRLGIPIKEMHVNWTEMPGSKIKFTSIIHMAFELVTLKVRYKQQLNQLNQQQLLQLNQLSQLNISLFASCIRLLLQACQHALALLHESAVSLLLSVVAMLLLLVLDTIVCLSCGNQQQYLSLELLHAHNCTCFRCSWRTSGCECGECMRRLMRGRKCNRLGSRAHMAFVSAVLFNLDIASPKTAMLLQSFACLLAKCTPFHLL